MGLLKLIRTHPKKALFAVVSASYLFSYANEKYNEDVLRRQYCQSVKIKSHETIPPAGQLRRLTVFLNPFARHGSLLKEFEKNVAPILQLSGLDVQMVYTDNDAEAKDYARVLDPLSTDGVLVASDDHVLQKVITALLERPDFFGKLRQIPVGIVPVGVWNSFAASMTGRQRPISWCFSQLTPLLNGSVQTQNVLEITTLPPPGSLAPRDTQSHSPNVIENASGDSVASRTAFSLSGLEWSIWRDVEHGGGLGAPKAKARPTNTNDHRGLLTPLSAMAPRSWTRRFGALWRHTWFWLKSTREVPDGLVLTSQDRMPAFFRENGDSAGAQETDGTALTAKHRFRSKRARLEYTPACDGCSKCWADRIQHLHAEPDPVSPVVVARPVQSRSTFSRLFGLSSAKSSAGRNGTSNDLVPIPLPEDRSHVQNDECGQTRTIELHDTAGVILALDGNNIRVELIPVPKGFLSYIRQSFTWLKTDTYREPLVAQSASPTESSESTLVFRCSTLRLFPEVTQNEFYWIDNDHFEACPIEVRVRINAINLYR